MGGKVLGTDGENLLWQTSHARRTRSIRQYGHFEDQNACRSDPVGPRYRPASGKAATLKLVTFRTFSNTPYFVKASVTAALSTASSLVCRRHERDMDNQRNV
ncbi:hypothetical protein [Xylella fastidiosa]|uniref:hypothetical protein n=1 Tax=Xylella fastidiosa TaxID=2371 RepID=UPI0039848042